MSESTRRCVIWRVHSDFFHIIWAVNGMNLSVNWHLLLKAQIGRFLMAFWSSRRNFKTNQTQKTEKSERYFNVLLMSSGCICHAVTTTNAVVECMDKYMYISVGLPQQQYFIPTDYAKPQHHMACVCGIHYGLCGWNRVSLNISINSNCIEMGNVFLDEYRISISTLAYS